jgi:hypothetical protein
MGGGRKIMALRIDRSKKLCKVTFRAGLKRLRRRICCCGNMEKNFVAINRRSAMSAR